MGAAVCTRLNEIKDATPDFDEQLERIFKQFSKNEGGCVSGMEYEAAVDELGHHVERLIQLHVDRCVASTS